MVHALQMAVMALIAERRFRPSRAFSKVANDMGIKLSPAELADLAKAHESGLSFSLSADKADFVDGYATVRSCMKGRGVEIHACYPAGTRIALLRNPQGVVVARALVGDGFMTRSYGDAHYALDAWAALLGLAREGFVPEQVGVTTIPAKVEIIPQSRGISVFDGPIYSWGHAPAYWPVIGADGEIFVARRHAPEAPWGSWSWETMQAHREAATVAFPVYALKKGERWAEVVKVPRCMAGLDAARFGCVRLTEVLPPHLAAMFGGRRVWAVVDRITAEFESHRVETTAVRIVTPSHENWSPYVDQF